MRFTKWKSALMKWNEWYEREGKQIKSYVKHEWSDSIIEFSADYVRE